MKSCLLLVAIVTVVRYTEGREVNKTFTAVTADGRVTEYTYPWKPESECVFNNNSITCVNNYSYHDVTAVWKERPHEIFYVSVNCLSRGLFNGRQCACADNNGGIYSPCQLTRLEDYTLRVLVNLEVLDLSNNMINSISARSLIGLNKLKYLALNNNPIKTLPMGALCHSLNLEYINLSNISLTSYPSNAFRCKKNFTKLTNLQISNNVLSTVPEHALDGMPNLLSLDLSDSLLSDISKSAIAGSISLESLDLSKNKISDLFPHFCDYFTNLSYIDIHNNAFVSFNFENLRKCSSLNVLDISMNSLGTLFGNISNLSGLKVFNLSDNNLSTVGLDFRELSSLEVLDLSLNSLWQLPDSIFSELKSLTFLDLSSNLINKTDNFQSVFTGLDGLLSLNLSFNKLLFIPNNSFSDLKLLKDLLLDNNFISDLDTFSFTGLLSLERILLDNNRLVKLPHDLFQPIIDKSQLKQLSLTYNQFSDLSSISKWPPVTSLDLSHNKLTSCPSAIDFTGMKTFNISHNELEVFFGAAENLIADFETLEIVDLSYNKISDIRISIFKLMKNLRHLNAENNAILFNFSTDVFKGLSNLELVNFASNRIGNIHTMISNNSLQNLRFLNMSSNPIEHIEQLSSNFNNSMLQTIDLSACNISRLNANIFSKLNRLKLVDLNSNSLITFPMFSANAGVVYNMKDNSLVCDCTMAWLSDRLVDVIHDVIDISVDTRHYHVSKCSVVGSADKYFPNQLSRDQFLCAEDYKCETSCECFKTTPEGEVFLMKCQNNLHSVPEMLSSTAKTIYLDGNSFSSNNSLTSLASLDKMATIRLYLNNSSIRFLQGDIFLPFDRLETLDLSHNLITTLTTNMFKAQTVLRQLYLHDNMIQTIELNVFNNLDTIQELDLSGNKLKVITPGTAEELRNLDYIPTFYLARNQWQCGCSNLPFKDLVDEVLTKIRDRNQLTCQSGKSQGREIKDIPRSEFLCQKAEETSRYNKTIIGVLIAAICVCLVLFAAFVYFRRELFSLLYFKTGCHIPGKSRYVGVHFDAYITYDPSDQHCSYYVQNTIMPKLKNNSYSFQTSCDVIQDVEVTRKVIEDSRCSIFIVDKNFSSNEFLVKIFLCATEWCKREKRHKIIIIIHGDIDLVAMEPEIVSRMRKGDYITARSRLWWERLVYELPVPCSSFNHGVEEDEEVVVFSSLSENQYQYEQF